jgi:putative membrane protein insertion efficiency factor
MGIAIGKRVVSLVISVANSIIRTIFYMPKGTCRYFPSCSDYAHEAIEKLPLWHALLKISGRIMRCNPLFNGGYDPVLRTTRKG